MTKTICLLGALLTLALGCGGDGDGRGGMDGGGIVLMDSGMPTDTGAPDTGSAADTGTPDTGTPRECEQALPYLPAAALPRCAATTYSCLMGCGANATCQNDCVDADTTAAYMDIDCGSCIFFQQLACGDMNGCHDSIAAFNCCVADSGCADAACLQTACGSQIGPLETCLNGVASRCQTPVVQCFAM